MWHPIALQARSRVCTWAFSKREGAAPQWTSVNLSVALTERWKWLYVLTATLKTIENLPVFMKSMALIAISFYISDVSYQ